MEMLEVLKASGKRVHEIHTPSYPTLYRKTGIYRGISIFLILDPNQIVGTR